MIKEITKTVKIDSSEIVEKMFTSITMGIYNDVRDYLKQHYNVLSNEDIDNILDDEEWWNSFSEKLINKIKM